jgi:hypothetical protein
MNALNALRLRSAALTEVQKPRGLANSHLRATPRRELTGLIFESALFCIRGDQFSQSSLLTSVAYPSGIFGGSLGLQAGHGIPAPPQRQASQSMSRLRTFSSLNADDHLP